MSFETASIKTDFREKLLEWYEGGRRDLPWRLSQDPYEIWVSEVMLQQTQTKKVLSYYRRFLQRFPSIPALAAATLDDVLKVWEGMGYYARARNLHRAAKCVLENHGGRLPSDYAALLAIPGIGPYTAAAVASIAFGEARAVVDGNVVRVITRLFLIEEDPREAETRRRLQELAQSLLDPRAPGDFNQAMMELGATVCTPKKPACLLCPVSSTCKAYKMLDTPARLPFKAPKKVLPHHSIVAGLIWDEGYIFIDRRQENGLLGGLWEFPGGKVEKGESPQEALTREIREELNLQVEVGDFFMEVQHAYTHFKITMSVFHCLYRGGEPELTAATDWRWIKPEELRFYAFPSANRKIIEKLESEFNTPANRLRRAGR